MKKNTIIKKMLQIAGQTINRHSLIKADDRVIVALSGGIDSLVLLDILHERKKHLPVDYKLYAVHIKIEDVEYRSDPELMKSFCTERSIPYNEINCTLNYSNTETISICNSCSRLRRKLIFDLCEDLGCNKAAFGHHMDDALETLFLNMTYNATMSSLPPRLHIFNDKLSIIRPLLNCSKEDILLYSKVRNIEPINRGCPHEDASKREKMRQILNNLHEEDSSLRKNLFKSMSNIHSDYLP